jgi:hypothetical protein
MRYATSLRRGYPIGSGPTEGACKSVVTMWFKRSGQRWLESGLAPCLSLRALYLSEAIASMLRQAPGRAFRALGRRVRIGRRYAIRTGQRCIPLGPMLQEFKNIGDNGVA